MTIRIVQNNLQLKSALRKLKPESLILIFPDGDPPEELLKKLEKKAVEYPDYAIGSAGMKIGRFPFYFSVTHNNQELNNRWWSFDIPVEGELVDVIFNYCGGLYRKKFLDGVKDISDYEISKTMQEKGIQQKIFKLPRVEITPQWSFHFLNNNSPFLNWQTLTYPAVLAVLFISLGVVALVTKK